MITDADARTGRPTSSSHGRKATRDERVNARKFNTSARMSCVAVVLAFAASLSGCGPVESLCPFFNPKDAVTDANLSGTWMSRKESGFYMKLRFQEHQDQSGDYQVEALFHDDRQDKDKPKEGTVVFNGQLFQVGDQRYLDFYPLRYSAKFGSRVIEVEAGDNLFGVPTHTLYRAKVEENHLQLSWLDETSVKAFLLKNDLSLAAESMGFIVLTAKTEELQTRLLLEAGGEDLFDGSDAIEFTRQE